MNRVIIGAIALVVVLAIIVGGVGVVRQLNLGRLVKRPTPTVGKLTLPSQTPETIVSPQPSISPYVMATPSANSFASPSASPVFVSRPSPSILPVSGGGSLPATGM